MKRMNQSFDKTQLEKGFANIILVVVIVVLVGAVGYFAVVKKLEPKEIDKSANDPYAKAQQLIMEEAKLEEGLRYCGQVIDPLKSQACYVAYTSAKIQRNEKIDKTVCDKIESVKTAFTQDSVTDCLKYIK